MNDQTQLDLAGFLAVVRRRKFLILAVGIIAAAAAFGLSSLQKDRYEAKADLLFRQAEPVPRVDPGAVPPDLQDSPERVAATNLALASLDTVAVRVKQKLKSPLSIEKLRDRVDLAPEGQADIVTITASGETRAEAVRLTNVFAEEVVAFRRLRSQQKVQDVIDAINRQLAAAPPDAQFADQLRSRAQQLEVEKRTRTGDVEIVEEAVPPRDRAAPKPLRNSVIGGVVGLLLGLLLVLLLHRLDRRVGSTEEVEEIVGAPVVGQIPVRNDTAWGNELFLEAFQFLRANVELRDPDSDHRVIAVTSPLPGNGKSTVTARLAEAMVLSGSDVIVVDCDLRRPTLHNHFGVDNRDGVTSVLLGGRNPVELLESTATDKLRVLTAGPLLPIGVSMITGVPAIGKMLGDLREVADYVLVDTSPITIGAETSAVVSSADAVLFVVDTEDVERDVLQAGAQQLRNARATTFGVVLNRAAVLLEDRDYRGYYSPGGRTTSPGLAGGNSEGNGDEGRGRRPGRAGQRSR